MDSDDLGERLSALETRVREMEERCERAAALLKEAGDRHVQAAGRELNETTPH